MLSSSCLAAANVYNLEILPRCVTVCGGWVSLGTGDQQKQSFFLALSRFPNADSSVCLAGVEDLCEMHWSSYQYELHRAECCIARWGAEHYHGPFEYKSQKGRHHEGDVQSCALPVRYPLARARRVGRRPGRSPRKLVTNGAV